MDLRSRHKVRYTLAKIDTKSVTRFKLKYFGPSSVACVGRRIDKLQEEELECELQHFFGSLYLAQSGAGRQASRFDNATRECFFARRTGPIAV